MTKILRVTLDIAVEDLSDVERDNLARLCTQDVTELPTLEDASADELAELLEGIATEGHNEMWFAGTDVFASFTHVTIVSADFR